METESEPKPTKKTGGDIRIVAHMTTTSDAIVDELADAGDSLPADTPFLVPLKMLGGKEVPDFESVVAADRFIRRHLTPKDGRVSVTRIWPYLETAGPATFHIKSAAE